MFRFLLNMPNKCLQTHRMKKTSATYPHLLMTNGVFLTNCSAKNVTLRFGGNNISVGIKFLKRYCFLQIAWYLFLTKALTNHMISLVKVSPAIIVCG